MSLPASPFGPNAPADHTGMLTRATWALAIGASDTAMNSVFIAGIARRIYCNASGTLYVQRAGDSVMTPYTVFAGQYLDGEFTNIGGTGTGSTAMTVNLEV